MCIRDRITDESTFSAKWYLANTEYMAINLGDHISGVFWAAFLLFSWTAASIVSGAIIERITTFAFGIYQIELDSVFGQLTLLGDGILMDGCLKF